ncbi:MAG: phage tail protein [Wenzhouxiangella sp.]
MASNGFIRIDDSQVRELESLFSGILPKELTRARRTALSRTRRGAQQRVSTLIRDRGATRYNIPARRAKDGIRITPLRNQAFFVIGSNKPISLTSYTGTRDLIRSGRGVSVAVIKGQRTRISSGFIRQPTGGPQVFRREFAGGKQVGRYPIRRLTGPSIADMMARNDAEADLADSLQDRFDRELKGAITAALRRRR